MQPEIDGFDDGCEGNPLGSPTMVRDEATGNRMRRYS
jgi:hypothetical protein